jgi:hemolysin activation/secretion protein
MAQGTTDIHVKFEERSPVHLTLFSNNDGSEFISRYRFGARAELTDALVPGGFLVVGGTLGNHADNMKAFNAQYELPVGSAGTRIGMSVFDGNIDLGRTFAYLGNHNEETSGNLYISHPLVRARKSSITGKLGFRVTDADYKLSDASSGRDNTRVIYLQLKADKEHSGGKSLAGLTISKGLGAILDGTGSGEALARRRNASDDFTRINLDLDRSQTLSALFSTSLRVSGQWTDDSLLASESWLIGGVSSVHGYQFGDGSGDRGYNASLSFSANPLKNRECLKFSAFIDYGYAYNRYILPGSKSKTDLLGVGFGVSSRIMTVAPTDFRVDIGFPLNSSKNNLSEKPVLYFETSIRL